MVCMEKRLVARYLILTVIFIGLVASLLVLRGVDFTGYAIYIDKGDGTTTLKLQTADSDNLGDVFADGGVANKNRGISSDLKVQRNPYQRVYIKFNISGVPVGQIIDNSQLCLYLYNDQGAQTVFASHVYVHDWDEGSEDGIDVSGQDYTTNLTWNNQPCGVDLDNSINCNLTAESSTVNDGTLDGTWQCWNVVNAVSSEYGSGDKDVSIILYTEDFGNPDIFHSKEYSDESLRPYLNVTYHTANTAPTITLVNPQDGATYGYNESIALDFSVSDADGNIDSCWYNLGGGDIVISNCENTTFDVAGNGDYILSVYVNDTPGEEASDGASFNVQIGAPTTILHSPSDVYLASQDVEFSYAPNDTDLQACELWGDFTGSWHLNQTDNSPDNGVENTFSLILPDGSYLWNIRCNDSQGNSAFNGNKTFYVDTVNPDLSVSEPSGTKNSRTGIPLTFSISENNLDSCFYNLSNWDGEKWVLYRENTIINCSIASTTFSVADDYTYLINLYVNDSAGNLNSTNSSFSVDTSTSPPISPPPSGGGSSGGGGTPRNVVNVVEYLELKELPSLIVNPGESRKLTLSAKNIGKGFLNDCKIKGVGDNADLISSEEIKGLSEGEEDDFIFSLKIPELLEVGSYNIELSLICQEANKSISFIAEIIEKKLAVDLISIEKKDGEDIEIFYSLTELSGFDQEVEVEIVLFGQNNERLAELTETKNIKASSNNEFSTVLYIQESLSGSFNLLINAISDTSSSFVQEELVLGSSRVGGLAVLDSEGTDILISVFLIIVFGIFAVFVIRRILKLRKLKKEK